MQRVEVTHLWFLITVFAIASCAGDDSNDTKKASDAGGDVCGQGEFRVDGQCVAPTQSWTQIKTGGETTCAKGAPYSFFVHPGKEDKLLIYFAFGGFCFNAELCRSGAPNFVSEVNVDEATLEATSGIFDFAHPDNPFKDWNVVYIPECTADFESGDKVTDYPAMGTSPAVTIKHKGFVNVTAVREWLSESFSAPERIVVSGSSGGGDAALMHYAYLREQYQNVDDWVFLLDASFGITTERFLTEDIANWGTYENRPKWIPSIAAATPAELTWDFSMIEGDKYYPKGVTAEFGCAYDTLQGFTYTLHGGDKAQWHDKLVEHLSNMSTNDDKFRYFVASGTGHIVFDQETFYQYHVNGVLLSDWVSDLANGKDVENHECTESCMVTRLMKNQEEK